MLSAIELSSSVAAATAAYADAVVATTVAAIVAAAAAVDTATTAGVAATRHKGWHSLNLVIWEHEIVLSHLVPCIRIKIVVRSPLISVCLD